jgi:DNA-binding NarL/FixJ family response regulator
MEQRTLSAEYITVLCVDDHRLMREGIVALIKYDPMITVVAEAGSGEEAIEQFTQHRPDVTLMDLQLRGMNGLHAIRSIRRLEPQARIVVLTMDERDDSVYHALQAGAAAYLQKDSVSEELIRVIREVHSGRQSISHDIESKLRQPSVLTIREIDVLERLAKGMRNREISISLQISEETVRAHIKSVFHKLNVHDRTAALSEALRRGIVHL